MMILLGLLTVPVLLLFNIYKSHQLPLPYSSKIDSLDTRSGDISDFLIKFGYIPKDDFRVGNIRSADYLKDAIKRMQKFAGLPATGEIDAATFNLTKRPRCGVPDYFSSDIRNRVKRYTLKGPKWDKLDLTWRVNGSTPATMRRNVLEGEIYQALLLWSRHSKLNFYPSGSSPADIVITFFRRDHGDNLAFDGPGGVLAHAFFPGPDLGGDAHFDADETWIQTGIADPSGTGTGLFGVAAHEFGHSLGLSHSPVTEALMFPYYRDIDFDFELPQDDINGIQALYGPPSNPAPTRRPTTKKQTTQRPNRPTASIPKITEPPVTCDTSFDAISTIRSEIFIFKGRYFWRLDENKNLERDYAIPINNFWFNLTKDFDKIDAVYERPLDSKIVFFLGQSYWVFDGNHADRGYPKPLYTLGLPRDLKSVDAVTTWGYNGLVYIFAGNQYWRLDERTNRVELDYPRSMKIWKGVPTNLDAAFHWQKNGRTYFFKGRGFWLFDDRTMSVTPDSPQSSVHYWFDPLCKNAEYPDLNDISSTESSIRDVNSSPSSRILITFSYFACLLVMLSLLCAINFSVNIS